MPFHFLAKLGLTEKQEAQLKQTMDEARSAKEAGLAAKADPMQRAWDRIVKEVLTKENLARLEELKRQAAHRRMVSAAASPWTALRAARTRAGIRSHRAMRAAKVPAADRSIATAKP